ncbi:putative pentapeptide repeat protein [Ralstonia phage RsoP1IDN]|uniref:Putative pentapeptide repeat protein n=1 Tax=Ralstonia phage RsoP1IDN TaxID=2060091 RepID=A0A2P0VPH6_9CAUD|nr:putative pentapeptide repeat protein [Ralstonia phage RsoP1IDN]AUG85443.1 putative pentapeptide repeat protein [Ralstonia phage RsoP1IDN]
MKFEIKHRLTDSVLFECDADLRVQVVEQAVKRGVGLRSADLRHAYLRDAALRDAYLRYADLRGADLDGADLRGADLGYADLRGANLRGADLRHAYLRDAYLGGANLSDADLDGANLTGADLSDADLDDAYLGGANLSDADLGGANLGDAPAIENIHQAVYAAASKAGALDMGVWHNACGTAHCRAGWVVTLAGDAGRALEAKIGTAGAALAIYLASDPERFKTERVPNFYCDNAAALADMERMAEEEATSAHNLPPIPRKLTCA